MSWSRAVMVYRTNYSSVKSMKRYVWYSYSTFPIRFLFITIRFNYAYRVGDVISFYIATPITLLKVSLCPCLLSLSEATFRLPIFRKKFVLSKEKIYLCTFNV